MDNPELVARVVQVVERLWEDGCPVAQHPQEIANASIRRWRSMARRHKKLTRDLQVRDIANGLVAVFEAKPELVGPLNEDYRHLASAIVGVLGPSPRVTFTDTA